jgi:hypothetical protein
MGHFQNDFPSHSSHFHPSLRSQALAVVNKFNAEWAICCLSMHANKQIPRAKSARGMTVSAWDSASGVVVKPTHYLNELRSASAVGFTGA